MILYKKLKMIFYILILDIYNNLNNYLQSMDSPAPVAMHPSVAGHGSETPSTESRSRPTCELGAGRAPPPRPFSRSWFGPSAWAVVVGKEGHPPVPKLDPETLKEHPLQYLNISNGWSCYNLDPQERGPEPPSPLSLALRDDVQNLDPPSLEPPSLADRDAKPPSYDVCNLPDCLVAGGCVCSVA